MPKSSPLVPAGNESDENRPLTSVPFSPPSSKAGKTDQIGRNLRDKLLRAARTVSAAAITLGTAAVSAGCTFSTYAPPELHKPIAVSHKEKSAHNHHVEFATGGVIENTGGETMAGGVAEAVVPLYQKRETIGPKVVGKKLFGSDGLSETSVEVGIDISKSLGVLTVGKIPINVALLSEVTGGYVEEEHGKENKKGGVIGAGLGLKFENGGWFVSPKGTVAGKLFSTPAAPSHGHHEGTAGSTHSTATNGPTVGGQLVGGHSF